MAVMGTRSFKGEIPRIEPHLLGPDNAQRAVGCDFANGSVKPLQDGFLLRNMQSNPVRGIYTEDGINFYTWPLETSAFRSPVIDDSYNRMYYLTPAEGLFRVASKLGMSFSGPQPQNGNRWKAGVPRPATAPRLAVVDRTTLPDYPSVAVSAEAWWEDQSGRTYQRGNAAVSQVTAFKAYSVAKPELPAPPEDGEDTNTYTLAVRIVFRDSSNNTEIMSSTVRPSQTSRSNALPGSVEFSLDEAAGGTSATVNLKWGTWETRAYTYTFRNDWKEEGAPAPAATISLTYLQNVRIEVDDAAALFDGYRPFDGVVIYRTFGSSAAYVEIDWTWQGGNVAIDSSSKPKSGGKALESTNWTPPPEGLQGIELVANGWFAAFKGNTLYMSEPYRPHAWPYNSTFPTAIRGIRATQQAIVVTTADGVYLMAGSFPGSAQQIKLDLPQPGIAQRSMVALEGSVAYASNDGFVLVAGTSASAELGQKLFDRRTWRSRYGTQLTDASMRFAYHDGAMISVSANEPNGFLLRLDEDTGSFTRLNARYDAMFLLPVNDALYYSIGSGVYQFRGGTEGSFEWHSRDYVFPSQAAFGAGWIRCDAPVELTVYADGQQVAQKTVSTGYFRLPQNMPRALRWSFKIAGAGKVHEVFISQSLAELKNV